MAIVRVPITIPCLGADGKLALLYLQDTYNINQQEWDVGETLATTDSQGSEFQMWIALLSLVHRMWLDMRVGLLNPLEGTAGGGTESGSVDFGSPV